MHPVLKKKNHPAIPIAQLSPNFESAAHAHLHSYTALRPLRNRNESKVQTYSNPLTSNANIRNASLTQLVQLHRRITFTTNPKRPRPTISRPHSNFHKPTPISHLQNKTDPVIHLPTDAVKRLCSVRLTQSLQLNATCCNVMQGPAMQRIATSQCYLM